MSGMGSHQAHGNGEKVWLTPPAIIDAVGPFDLDPCFGAPRPWETATTHYGPDSFEGQGGLTAPWFGLVWCNPPYDSHAWRWLARCADHGNAIALIFSRTEVEQFHRQVWERASSVLFLEGRLYFHYPDGSRAPANGGVVLDPFFGAGTTGLVAQRNDRSWIGCELNEDYAGIARRRLGMDESPAMADTAFWTWLTAA